MLVFLDFEASSLTKHSYPIEIAWVFEDGRSRTFLIRPAPGWTDWSAKAEAIHGIPRELLEHEGAEITVIVQEMMETLIGADLVASAPSWDGKWLSALLRSGGLPRHTLRLRKSDEAFREAARASNAALTEEEIAVLAEAIIQETEPGVPAHRALPDAVLEWERWKAVRERARFRSSRPEGLGT